MLPEKKTNRRCQWYNEFGWPRINPKKDYNKAKQFLGCTFGTKCSFLHPDDPGWSTGITTDPLDHLYPGGMRQKTPPPPPPARSLRPGTPDRDVNVKEEHVSPKLPLPNGESSRWTENRRDHSSSRPRSPTSRNESRNPYRGPAYRPGRSISRSRSRSRERYPDRGRLHDGSRDGHRYRGRSRERDNLEYDKDRDRNKWRQPPSSRFGPRPPPSSPRGLIDPRQRMLDISERRRAGSIDYNSSRRPPEREAITASARPESAVLPSPNNTDRAPSTTLRDSLDARNLTGNITPGKSLPPSKLTQRDATSQPPPPVAATESRPPSIVKLLPPLDSAATEASFVSQQIAPPPPDSAMTQTSFASQMPPPPNPLAVPQAPSLPELVAPEAIVGKKESISFEERMKIWDRRIEVLVEATNARQRYQALAADVKELKRHTSSTHFTGLTPAVQATVFASVKEAEIRCEEAKKHADTVMGKLYKADFWPVRKPPVTAQGDGAEEGQLPGTDWEEEHELMKNEVSDLSTAVRKIDQTLHEVVAFVSPHTRSTSVASTVVPPQQSRASVDVEMRDSTRAAKRRRVEDEADVSVTRDVSNPADPSTPTLGTPIETSAPPVHHDNLDVARLMRRVEQIETQLADLENLSTQAEENAISSMDDRIDTRLEEFRRDFKRRQSEAIAALKVEVEQVDEDIKEISTEMAQLINREVEASAQLNTWKLEEARLSTEIAEMKASFDQERARSDEMQTQLKACMEGLTAVNLVLQTKQHTPPPPPPYSMSVDDIVEAIKPIVIDSVRGDLTSTMEEMRTNISKFVKANSPTTSQLEAMREKFAKVSRLPEVAHFLQNYTSEKPKTNGHPPP